MTTETSATAAAAALPPGSPERAAAMADLYTGRHNPGSALAGARPENVPEKFWDPDKGTVRQDALLSAYLAMEAKQGAAKTEVPAGTDPNADTPPADGAVPKLEIPEGKDPVEHVVTAAGLNVEALSAKIVTDGKLDDADIAAIEKLGIPRALIDAHVTAVSKAAQTAVAENDASAATALGGADRMAKVLEWAGANLPDAEKARLNGMLKSAGWRDAVDVLNSRYSAAHPASAATIAASREPNLRQGNNSPPTVAGYRSVSERTADMNNPKYRTDPAFRAQVRARMAVSTYDLDR